MSPEYQEITSEKGAPGRPGRRVRIPFLLSLLLALILLLFLNHDLRAPILPEPFRESADRWPISLLTSPEVKRLMRYHGVNGLYITGQAAFMKRDGLWICIFHDPPTEQELKIVRRIVAPLQERTATLVRKSSPEE